MGKILWSVLPFIVGLALVGMAMTDRKRRILRWEECRQKNFDHFIRLYFEHTLHFIARK